MPQSTPRPPRRLTAAHRRRRATLVVLLVAIVVVAVRDLAAGGSRPRVSDPTPVPPSAATAPTTTTTAPAPATTSTTALAGPDRFAFGTTALDISAASPAGGDVMIPTTVWYPAPGTPGAAAGASVAPDRAAGPFPLVMFSPGFDIAPGSYAGLTQSWASAGYVVAEPVYPDTAPGGPLVEADMANHPAELGSVITVILANSAGTTSLLSGLVNPAQVAVAGHSDGGDVSLAVAANSRWRDSRVKAALVLSGAEWANFGGTYYSGGSPPLLVVQGTTDATSPPQCSAQLYDGAPQPRYYISLLGVGHRPAYTEDTPDLALVESATIAFLDVYVKGVASRLSAFSAAAVVAGQSVLFAGAQAVPVTGSCAGAPPGV